MMTDMTTMMMIYKCWWQWRSPGPVCTRLPPTIDCTRATLIQGEEMAVNDDENVYDDNIYDNDDKYGGCT